MGCTIITQGYLVQAKAHRTRHNAMVMIFTLLQHQLLCSLYVASLRLVCDAEVCSMVPCARMLIEALHTALESRSE